MKHSLPPLRGQYPKNQKEADETRQALQQLTAPANKSWIAQRAVKILAHYFVAEMHPEILKSISEDWNRELAGYPEWAIEEACRWWLSQHNKKRRQKPMPGDISEVAQRSMGMTKLAERLVDAYDKHGPTPPSYMQ